MYISQKQLDKYKALCKQVKNIELTEQEAREEAVRLVILYKAIYRPVTKEMFERLKQRDAEYSQAGVLNEKKND